MTAAGPHPPRAERYLPTLKGLITVATMSAQEFIRDVSAAITGDEHHRHPRGTSDLGLEGRGFEPFGGIEVAFVLRDRDLSAVA